MDDVVGERCFAVPRKLSNSCQRSVAIRDVLFLNVAQKPIETGSTSRKLGVEIISMHACIFFLSICFRLLFAGCVIIAGACSVIDAVADADTVTGAGVDADAGASADTGVGAVTSAGPEAIKTHNGRGRKRGNPKIINFVLKLEMNRVLGKMIVSQIIISATFQRILKEKNQQTTLHLLEFVMNRKEILPLVYHHLQWSGEETKIII